MGPALITLDTSGLFALLNRRDPDHDAAKETFLEDGGPYLVPIGILAELGYMVEVRLGVPVLDALLEDLVSGALSLECGEEDIPRVRELVNRYHDLPLGFADAAVVACAERNGGRVLALDERDFGVVEREGTIAVLPA